MAVFDNSAAVVMTLRTALSSGIRDHDVTTAHSTASTSTELRSSSNRQPFMAIQYAHR